MTELPVIREGMAQPPVAAGLGTRLQDSFKQQPDCIVRESR